MLVRLTMLKVVLAGYFNTNPNTNRALSVTDRESTRQFASMLEPSAKVMVVFLLSPPTA